MAMTAPVLTGPKEGSQLNEVEFRKFVLPFEFSNLQQVPKPTSSNVKVHAIPAKIIATTTFPGYYSNEEGQY